MKNVDEEIVYNNDLEELDIDLADLLLNEILSDEITELPFIRILNVLWKTGKGVKEYLFKKKLIAFLNETHDIGFEKNKKFIKKIEDKNLYEKVGTSLLQVIERLDSNDKATLVGKLYSYVVENEVESDVFFRCCYLIDRCYYEDILELQKFKIQEKILSVNKLMKTEVLDNLYSIGFIKSGGYDGGGFKDDDDEGTEFMLNYYGELLLKIL